MCWIVKLWQNHHWLLPFVNWRAKIIVKHTQHVGSLCEFFINIQPRTTDQSHMTRMEPKQKKAKSMSIGLDFAIFQIIVNLTTWFCKLSKQNKNMTSRYISDCQYLKQIFVEISEKSIFSWLGSSASKLGHCISKVAFNHLVYCHNPHQQSRDGRWKVIPVCVSVSEKPARGGESSIWLSVKEAFVYLWL